MARKLSLFGEEKLGRLQALVSKDEAYHCRYGQKQIILLVFGEDAVSDDMYGEIFNLTLETLQSMTTSEII